MSCHNGLHTPSGEDVSIGASWRASMMANSSRDPYWQAGVRTGSDRSPRCGTSDSGRLRHVPHADVPNRGAYQRFDRAASSTILPVTRASGSDRSSRPRRRRLLHVPSDYRSESRNGRQLYRRLRRLHRRSPRACLRRAERPVFGPFKIERGMTTIMRSATGFQPTEATAHTAVRSVRDVSHARDASARSQRRGDRRAARTDAVPGMEAQCIRRRRAQLPVLPHAGRRGRHTHCVRARRAQERPRTAHVRRRQLLRATHAQSISSRSGCRGHGRRAGNVLKATVDNLQKSTAELSIDRAERAGGRVIADVRVRNLTGHKLPTGYPSRRAWLHVTVRDRAGAWSLNRERSRQTAR